MNDIMFAVTFGINKVFQFAMESIKGSREPEMKMLKKGHLELKIVKILNVWIHLLQQFYC